MIKREIIFGSAIVLMLMSSFIPRLAAAEPIIYESGGRRDPFIALTGSGAGMQVVSGRDVQIEGIIFDPTGGSLALVNGEFYKQGDHVGESTIISIFKDRVILSQDSEEKTLWIREEVLKGEIKNAQKTIPSKKH